MESTDDFMYFTSGLADAISDFLSTTLAALPKMNTFTGSRLYHILHAYLNFTEDQLLLAYGYFLEIGILLRDSGKRIKEPRDDSEMTIQMDVFGLIVEKLGFLHRKTHSTRWYA
jgi:hypothetical protein